jgi:AcrR family transcriptional regulator
MSKTHSSKPEPPAAPQRKRREVKGPKSVQRVESLLAVARDVFAERGFEKATTAEIASRLGVSEATVFSYFVSKRELCIEVVKRWYDEMSRVLEEQLPPIGGTRAKLHHAVRLHLKQLMGEGRGMCALVLSEGRVADAAFVELIRTLKQRYVAPLLAALAAARSAGEIRDDVPLGLMRDMVYGSMEHVLWSYVASGRKPNLEATSVQLVDMLWAAFAPPQADVAALAQFRASVSGALQALEGGGRR